MIFSFGNVAYGFFIQFAECLPWRAGSCFRADALQSKVASLDFELFASKAGPSKGLRSYLPKYSAKWGNRLRKSLI